MNSWPTWSMYQVSGQPKLHSETTFQLKKKVKIIESVTYLLPKFKNYIDRLFENIKRASKTSFTALKKK